MFSGCRSGARPTLVAVDARPKALCYKMTACKKVRAIKVLVKKLPRRKSLVSRCYKIS